MNSKNLHDLIDKVIGKKGTLRTPAYWMRRVFRSLMEWVEGLTAEVKRDIDRVTSDVLRQLPHYTYNELHALKDAGRLLPGQQYVLTDYTPVLSAQCSPERFDIVTPDNTFIILTATSSDSFSKNATMHVEDNSQLERAINVVYYFEGSSRSSYPSWALHDDLEIYARAKASLYMPDGTYQYVGLKFISSTVESRTGIMSTTWEATFDDSSIKELTGYAFDLKDAEGNNYDVSTIKGIEYRDRGFIAAYRDEVNNVTAPYDFLHIRPVDRPYTGLDWYAYKNISIEMMTANRLVLPYIALPNPYDIEGLLRFVNCNNVKITGSADDSELINCFDVTVAQLKDSRLEYVRDAALTDVVRSTIIRPQASDCGADVSYTDYILDRSNGSIVLDKQHLNRLTGDGDSSKFLSADGTYRQPPMEEPPYLTFENVSDTKGSIRFSNTAAYYRLDYGDWTECTSDHITVAPGQMVQFKGNLTPSIRKGVGNFTMTNACFKASGTPMTLLTGDGPIGRSVPDYAFYSLFDGCTSLVNAPELPAMALADSCYRGMFAGCTSLVNAPELPATTLAENCYNIMFAGCTSLVNAPELPAMALADSCYFWMFGGCTSLVKAPELPATKLTVSCYNSMFDKCTSLVNAPELPATTLAENCYGGMFSGCTSLVNAPELPVTTLAENCYSGMFSGCTSLVNAPELPATTLAKHCYDGMFRGCTSLVKAPTLHARTTQPYCYNEMFKNCYHLNYVISLHRQYAAFSTYQWLAFVDEEGTFVKADDAEWDIVGVTGIPEGWTVLKESDFAPYLTFEALEDDMQVKLSHSTCEYRIDDGEWVELPADTETPAIAKGQKVAFRANAVPTEENGVGTFSFTKNVSIIGGTPLSLLHSYKSAYNHNLSDYCFRNLFKGSTHLISAARMVLPSEQLAVGCYWDMFNGCGNLADSPELPATSLADYCYNAMYYDCTSLVNAPELPATGMKPFCYNGMFSGCTSLENAPELPATTLAEQCYYCMFFGCTSLENAPELPAKTLATRCYHGMFNGCTSLAKAPELPATKLTVGCYAYMFQSCTGMVSGPSILPATVMEEECYKVMFQGCTSMVAAPEIEANTLLEGCFSFMFQNCTSMVCGPSILPASSMKPRCYEYMFNGCTALTSMPRILATSMSEGCCYGMFMGCTSLVKTTRFHATYLATDCYCNMFNGCTSLVNAPELPATTLAENCYGFMFQNCTSMVSGPSILPATTLQPSCYFAMFMGCTALENAPELPATALALQSYWAMFNGCSSLKKVKAMFLYEPDPAYTNEWMAGVAAEGVFIKNSAATWTTVGTSAVPEGWTVEYSN